MHELSVTENILEITLRHASKANAARVTDLHLVIGDLTSIVDDSVQFYWDMISEGTAAAGARLHFRRIPTVFHCQQCRRQYGLSEGLTCPACGSSDSHIVSGKEFYLEAIDIEEGPDGCITTPEETPSNSAGLMR